jgi:hypothetical protein
MKLLFFSAACVPLGNGFIAARSSPTTLRSSNKNDVLLEEEAPAVVVDKAVNEASVADVQQPFEPEKVVPVRRVKNTDEWFMRALPFAARPALLDGTLAADAGFDPAGLATTKVDLYNLREAEVKHARLAMLCAAGWPLGELWDDGIAKTLSLPSIIALNGGRDPSLLNGGLDLISPAYWLGVIVLAGVIEYRSETIKEQAKAADKTWMMSGSWIPGTLGFDPFGLYTALAPDDRGKFLMETAELKNGRLAMCAVFGYVVEELLTGKSVVSNTPIFFTPFWKLVEDIMIGAPAPYAM